MNRLEESFRLMPILYALLLCAPAVAVAQSNEQLSVAYCKVAGHFARYDHKVFRIKGVYRSGGEIMSFYDPSCPAANLTAWVDYSPDFRQRSSPELVAAMEKLLKADGRAKIDVLVEFDGPKPVTVPDGTSPDLAAVIRETNSRYGHANQFRFRVLFLQVLKVKSVEHSAPWPQFDATPDAEAKPSTPSSILPHESGHVDSPKQQ